MWNFIKARWKAWVTVIPPAALILIDAIWSLGLTSAEQLIVAGALTAIFVERTPNQYK